MRKDVIVQALPVLGEQIKFKQEMADEYLMKYQLHGYESYANVAAKYQHDTNVLAELYNDLAAELDRQRQHSAKVAKLLRGVERLALDRQRHQ